MSDNVVCFDKTDWDFLMRLREWDCWTRLMECENLAETEGILTINFFNYWEIQKKLVNMNDSNEFICVAESDWM